MSTKRLNDEKRYVIIGNEKYSFETKNDIDFLVKEFGKKAVNDNGETIYHILLQNLSNIDLINWLLIKMFVNDDALFIKDKTGWTPLHYLGMMGIKGIDIFVESHTMADNNGITPHKLLDCFQNNKCGKA